jgi:hypothetical protein
MIKYGVKLNMMAGPLATRPFSPCGTSAERGRLLQGQLQRSERAERRLKQASLSVFLPDGATSIQQKRCCPDSRSEPLKKTASYALSRG